MSQQGAIEYRRTPEYLHATVIGPRTREFASRFFREIPERCTQLGSRRVLIEMRLEGEPLNVSTIFDLTRHFVAEIKGQHDPILAVAFVGPYPDIPKLAEIASANRGVKIAGFVEISAAEGWLLDMTSGGHREDERGTQALDRIMRVLSEAAPTSAVEHMARIPLGPTPYVPSMAAIRNTSDIARQLKSSLMQIK